MSEPSDELVELGRQVHNCEKHGGDWCSCKVREFVRTAHDAGLIYYRDELERVAREQSQQVLREHLDELDRNAEIASWDEGR